MLNENEVKLVRKYYLLAKIALTAFIMALAIGGVWIVLVMIDDIGFSNKSFYSIGLVAYLTIVILYMILFFYAYLSVKLGGRKQAWIDIVEKASRRAEEECWNAKNIAKACRIELPKAKKYVLALIFIPIIALTAIYIPEFMESKRVNDEERRVAAEAVHAVNEAFEKDCRSGYYDNPYERYQDYGYTVRGYLYDYEAPDKSYVSVEIGNDGIVNQVIYHASVDIRKSKEENLQRAEKDIQQLNKILNRANVKIAAPDLFERYTLSDEFKEKFMSGSYYEEIDVHDISEGDCKIYTRYCTDSKEEYDEYSSSYIFMNIEKR